jgi:hypothetical protein
LFPLSRVLSEELLNEALKSTHRLFANAMFLALDVIQPTLLYVRAQHWHSFQYDRATNLADGAARSGFSLVMESCRLWVVLLVSIGYRGEKGQAASCRWDHELK